MRVTLPATKIKVNSSTPNDFKLQVYDPVVHYVVINQAGKKTQTGTAPLRDKSFTIDRSQNLRPGDIVTVALDQKVNVGKYMTALNGTQIDWGKLQLHVIKIERPDQPTHTKTVWQEH